MTILQVTTMLFRPIAYYHIEDINLFLSLADPFFQVFSAW